MAASVMRAYCDIRFYRLSDGVPLGSMCRSLVGEDDGEPGYTMLGRLFAFGYMRGLMHAVDDSDMRFPRDSKHPMTKTRWFTGKLGAVFSLRVP